MSASFAQNQIATLADSVDLGFSKPAARELAKLASADLSWALGLDVIADAIAKRQAETAFDFAPTVAASP